MKHQDKDRYVTKRLAIRAAIVYSRRGKPLRVYRCPECNAWHLTSQERRGSKRTA